MAFSTRFTTIAKYGSMLALGLLGAGLFQVGSCAYQDLTFLHAARVITERQAAQPVAAPPPIQQSQVHPGGPTPTTPTTPTTTTATPAPPQPPK